LGLAQAVLPSGRLFLGAWGRISAVPVPVPDRRRRRFSLVAISRRRVKIDRSLLTDGRRRLYWPCAPRKPLRANAHPARGCERRPGQRGLCLVRHSCSWKAKLCLATRGSAATSRRRLSRSSLSGRVSAGAAPTPAARRSVGRAAPWPWRGPRSPLPRQRDEHKTGSSRR